jgi:hypothetical protein
LQKDESITVYKTIDAQVTATRTDKNSPMDFGVGLVLRNKEFRPTHVRLLFDLHLKRRSDPDKSEKLFYALEKVYEGEDPEKLASDLKSIHFRMQLDSAETNLHYAQLLMVEQDFNYIPEKEINRYVVRYVTKKVRGREIEVPVVKIVGKEMEKKVSNLNPPRDFLMRFIRWTAKGELENIDDIITCAVRNRPADKKFGERLFSGLSEPLPWVLKLLNNDFGEKEVKSKLQDIDKLLG